MTFDFFPLSFSSAISDTWRGQLRCSFATELVVFASLVTPGFTVLYGIASMPLNAHPSSDCTPNEKRLPASAFLFSSKRCFGFGKNLSGKFQAAKLRHTRPNAGPSGKFRREDTPFADRARRRQRVWDHLRHGSAMPFAWANVELSAPILFSPKFNGRNVAMASPTWRPGSLSPPTISARRIAGVEALRWRTTGRSMDA
jgi:hypothetical protein